jgi:hypothetical protein
LRRKALLLWLQALFEAADVFRPILKGFNGLKCPAPVGAGGHNNIEINPVFRGMVCFRYGGADF